MVNVMQPGIRTAAMSLKHILCAATLLLVFELPAHAHDIYSDLRDRLGNSCCDDTDCRPASYRHTAQGVQMYVGSKWITVPHDTIQYRALPGDIGETAGGHWCGIIRDRRRYSTEHVTLCAILPPNAATMPRPSFPLHESLAQAVP